MNYIFDIDGTIAPARQRMPLEHRRIFADWTIEQKRKDNRVFFVTGGGRITTVNRIGVSLWRFVDGVYQCCGNQLYIRGRKIKESTWKMSAKLRYDIICLIHESTWYEDGKLNIEERKGMINVSTVGRDCSKAVRKKYFEWDKTNSERKHLIDILSKEYPELEFSIRGDIGVDIYPKGRDKSQVLADMSGVNIFFGDRCEEGGSDHNIAMMSDEYYHVKDWNHTYEIIKEIDD